MAKYPSEEKDRFIVRMPDGMREELKSIAAKNSRSLNAEIVARLAESLEMDAVTKTPEASYDAIKPLMDVLKVEFANLYEDKLEAMRAQLSEISSQLHAQRDGEAR